MRRGYTHAKAVHHAGPVCGADDGPLTRVTEDPHLVTCLDCPDLVWYDALKPATRAKLAALRIDRMAQVAWRLLRPHV